MTDEPWPYSSPDEAEQAYAIALGRFMRAWNLLQSQFQMVFLTILRENPVRVSIAIWNSLYNDRTQRAMMLNAIDGLAQHFASQQESKKNRKSPEIFLKN